MITDDDVNVIGEDSQNVHTYTTVESLFIFQKFIKPPSTVLKNKSYLGGGLIENLCA